MHVAASENEVGPLEVLLQYDGTIDVEGMGEPVSGRMSVMHNTPLMSAAFQGSNDALRFLLGKGADWRLRDGAIVLIFSFFHWFFVGFRWFSLVFHWLFHRFFIFSH